MSWRITMNLPRRFVQSALVVAVTGFTSASALAAVITDWDRGNVVTTGPDADGNFFSTVYDQPTTTGSGASTSGYIKYTPPEGANPGLKVVNNAAPNPDNIAPAPGRPVDNCIMAAGDASCNSEFQSGKRFKLDRTGFDPIDLVFNLDGSAPAPDNDGLYKVFQKYGNNTGVALGGYTIGLGFGIGDDFVSSGSGDGLSFVDFGADPRESEFSSVFAQGLFGRRVISVLIAAVMTWHSSPRICSRPRACSVASTGMNPCSVTGCPIQWCPTGISMTTTEIH